MQSLPIVLFWQKAEGRRQKRQGSRGQGARERDFPFYLRTLPKFLLFPPCPPPPSPPPFFSPSSPHSLLQLAAAVESGTHHPLAKAIQQAAKQQQLSIPEAVDFHTEPGMGVSGVVDGETVLLGNWDWLSWHGVTLSETTKQ